MKGFIARLFYAPLVVLMAFVFVFGAILLIGAYIVTGKNYIDPFAIFLFVDTSDRYFALFGITDWAP